MDKLQYDNLYKFLVSLGIVLIVLPVAALVFLFNMERAYEIFSVK